MKISIYRFIDYVFFLLTILTIIVINPVASSVISIKNVFFLLGTFLIIHISKCIRQYLLLIESNIHIKDFVLLYIKGTFCSIVLPFKLGDLYKAFLYGKEVKNYIKGFITIIVDKFFDASLLLFIMIVINFVQKQAILTTIIEWVMLIFLILVIVIYITFNSTYYYLNKYLVFNRNSKKAIIALNILEKTNDLYIYIKNMIKGRALLITLLTIFSWTFEWFFIKTLNVGNFIAYINAVFLGMTNTVFSNYIIISIICYIVIGLVLIIGKWCNKSGKDSNYIR